MTHLTGKRVAIIATDWFEEPELVEPRDRLRGGGAEVKVYSPDGQAIQAAQGDTNPTSKVEVDGSLADLDAAAVDVLLVPGGTVNADTIRTNDQAKAAVHTAMEGGRTVAAICHGPWLLVSAGVVEGRRMTSWASLADDLRNAGADWVDEQVVVDGQLITSRKPDDIPAFVEAIEGALTGSGS